MFTQILSQLIDRSQDFLGARTVYLIVDSRLPHSVDYWPAFQPWWASREQLVGPHKEVTRMVWYHINDQSGVQYVPHTWAGVFVLLVARFLFPSINIALVDTDCVPVSLFEVEDLIQLSKLQMSAHVLPLVGFLHRISLRLVCCFFQNSFMTLMQASSLV